MNAALLALALIAAMVVPMAAAAWLHHRERP